MKTPSRTIRKIQSEICKCREDVLFTVQYELGETPRWEYVRSQLLKAFGRRGLEARITEALEENTK